MLAASLMTQGSRIAPVSIGLGKANQLASSKTLAKPNLRLIALWPLSRRGDALKTSSAGEKDLRSVKPRPRVAESRRPSRAHKCSFTRDDLSPSSPLPRINPPPAPRRQTSKMVQARVQGQFMVENFDEAQK